MSNREIKFRAWDGVDLLPVQIINWATEMIELGDGEQTIKFANMPNAILMQYTDLHDKNGTEIFEGDILRFDYGEIKKVEYSAIEDYYVGFLPFDGNFEYDNHAHQCEVIGNIYENPELLEQAA